MHAVPPLAIGKSPSMTRCPVTSGSFGRRRSRYGLGVLTGQRCIIGMETSRPKASFRRAMSSLALWSPAGAIHVISPSRPSGVIILWTRSGVSCTVASTTPPDTRSPTFATGVMSQFLSRSIMLTVVPGLIYIPSLLRSESSGRPIPSKKLPMSPGPSSIESGSPVPSTVSSMRSPSVSS